MRPTSWTYGPRHLADVPHQRPRNIPPGPAHPAATVASVTVPRSTKPFSRNGLQPQGPPSLSTLSQLRLPSRPQSTPTSSLPIIDLQRPPLSTLIILLSPQWPLFQTHLSTLFMLSHQRTTPLNRKLQNSRLNGIISFLRCQRLLFLPGPLRHFDDQYFSNTDSIARGMCPR